VGGGFEGKRGGGGGGVGVVRGEGREEVSFILTSLREEAVLVVVKRRR